MCQIQLKFSSFSDDLPSFQSGNSQDFQKRFWVLQSTNVADSSRYVKISSEMMPVT